MYRPPATYGALGPRWPLQAVSPRKQQVRGGRLLAPSISTIGFAEMCQRGTDVVSGARSGLDRCYPGGGLTALGAPRPPAWGPPGRHRAREREIQAPNVRGTTAPRARGAGSPAVNGWRCDSPGI